MYNHADPSKTNPTIEVSGSDNKAATSNAPLAPPPKPNQQSNPDSADYFSAGHTSTHLSYEPNPFEQSFSNPTTDGPNKHQQLPPVASLTSPAPLGPGGTPGWQGSLRSGPLSPAMLAGPAPSNYFDESFRGSFPTPNESSLRTGLTPGGGGSMFPAPSPNSQAIYNSLQSGGATPGTLDFQRTALNAAARTKTDNNSQAMSGPTPQGINKQEYQPAQQRHPGTSDQFQNHHETDAVNSLYLLAQTGNRSANQFAVPSQGMSTNVGQNQRMGNTQESPTTRNRQSMGSMGTGMSDGGDYDMSDGSMENSGGKARGKKGGSKSSNGRRKTDDTPTKGSNKRSRASMGESDDEESLQEMTNSNGKKMTDEEKRRNFLERNR